MLKMSGICSAWLDDRVRTGRYIDSFRKTRREHEGWFPLNEIVSL